MDLQEFHRLIGETLMCCQTIENDVKVLWAGMCKGYLEENFEKIRELTLGQAVKNLEELDNCDGNPSLSRHDYRLLKEISRERNYIVHNIYQNFVYEPDYINSTEYANECDRLSNFHSRLVRLYESIQKARIDILRELKRID